MRKIPKFWGLHARPPAALSVVLGIVPFVVLIVLYLTVSHIRLTANPSDKLTPSVTRMVDAVKMMAFTKDTRTGTYLMLTDTISSLRRMAIGLGLAALVGLFLGMHMGTLPGPGVLWLPFITFLSIIPPLAILPILFIVFGVGELGKVMLIFLGALFMITRDICDATQRIPREQIVKALTLGASQVAVFTRIVFPQVMPRLFVTVRLCLGGAWLFLIAAEAIASTDGLGYRIFLVRRYLSMNVIIPYVLWITLLGFFMDALLRLVVKWKYPWYGVSEQ